MTIRNLAIASLSILLSLFAAFAAPDTRAAPGDLTVTPTRIIFDERDRSAQVYLINRGETRATYRIEFIQMRMDETGQMVEIQSPNEKELFAHDLIRYSPRQIELEPNQGQTIRLLLRKPENLAPGEYRSHLLFYALPDAASGADIERERGVEQKTLSVAIQAVFRISIPVIVRHGDLPVEFSMHDLTLQPGKPDRIALRIERRGRRSVYGDLDVYFEPATGGERILLKHLKDFVLYTSNDTRRLDIEVDKPGDIALRNGTLHAIYSETVDDKTRTLAEQRIPVP